MALEIIARPRRLALLAALAAASWSTGARAQINFNMGPWFGWQNAINLGEMNESIYGWEDDADDAADEADAPRAASAQPRRAKAAAPDLARTERLWSYRPQAAVRRQVMDEFLSAMRKGDPAGAASLSREFAMADPIVGLGAMVRPLGLRTDSFVDALTIFTIVSLEASEGVVTDGDLKQTQAVRRQLLDGLAASSAAPQSAQEAQRMADQLMLQAMLVSHYNNQAQNNPAIRAGVRQGAAAGLRKIGFDPDTIRLTPDGLAPAR